MQKAETVYPSGKVTFLMYDGVGSSQVALHVPYEQYRDQLLQKLYDMTEALVTAYHGLTSGTSHGDDWMAVFERAMDAIECAVALQEQAGQIRLPNPEESGELHMPLRIVVHTAVQQVQPDAKGHYQNHPEVIRAARVLPLACAEQILLTESALDAAGVLPWKCKSHPNRRLRSFEEKAQTFYELLYDGKERDEPGSKFLPDWFRETNHYIARPTLENAVADLFAERTANGQFYRLVTLHGFGGMGKTRLAVQCALNAAGIFEDRMFYARLGDITSDQLLADETLRRDYLHAALLQSFAIEGTPPPSPEELPRRVKWLLDHLPRPGDSLLLLDNWETVKGKLSTRLVGSLLRECPQLRILTTGREALNLLNVERKQEVVGLEPKEASALLLTRIREQKEKDWHPSPVDEAAIARLISLTEGIPLALELVAAHSGEKTLTKIADALEAEPLASVTALPADFDTLYPETDRHESLERCLNWSWKLLEEAAQIALACLSLFAAPCSAEEVSACFPSVEPVHLTLLQRAALARWGDTTDAYSLLRPTRAYARRRLQQLDTDKALQGHFVAFYRQIVEENGGPSNLEDREKRQHLEAVWRHALAAAHSAEDLEDYPSFFTFADQLILFLDRQAHWAEAEPLLKRALEIYEKVLGPEHLDTATRLNNLAALYENQGNYPGAEPLLKRALAIREKALGPEHLDTVTSLNNLAALYDSQGRYEEAEPLYKQALAIHEKVLGPEHSHTAASLNNLAALYGNQDNYPEAEPLYKRALAIREKALGPEHSHTANSLHNLAGLYNRQGRYEEAEPLYKRALAIREKALGPEHPHTVTSLHNLAGLYNRQGRYEEAEPLYKRALAIREKALGPEHPDTVTSLNNLAFLYESQGRYEEAEPLYIRALAIYEKVLGPEHSHTAASLHNLAGLYSRQGRYEEAEPFYKRALEICEKVLGPEHPDTKIVRNNYMQIRQAQTKRNA